MGPPGFVFAVHPTCRGFGWIVFERPNAPFDWGAATIGREEQGVLSRFGYLLKRYRPGVLVMEQFAGAPARRAPRIQEIASTMIVTAQRERLATSVLTLETIRQTFAVHRARTREQIAKAVAESVEPLRALLPPTRKIWQSEHPRLSIFTAAACALSWYAELS
jgi:hypothetical protein